MLAIVKSCAVVGLKGQMIDVEVDVSRGLPSFDIVGLPNTSVKEAKERVRTALKNSGFEFPLGRITVNMAPAEIKKEGASYDLPIAIGILIATGQLQAKKDWVFLGELSLDGTLRPIKGVLPRALESQKAGFSNLLVPLDNAIEGALAQNLQVVSFSNLKDIVECFDGEKMISRTKVNLKQLMTDDEFFDPLDFADVKGQESAKRALEIAAAGGHNVIMVGPPGSGKTMLAKRLPTILPQLSIEESLEVTQIHSVAGLVNKKQPLIIKRPFRSPHHTITGVSLVGGGSTPKPGEISLAHNGVLFLDEFPEFPKQAIEALREPLEEGQVTISRINGSFTYPAQLTLVAGMNPCYCGFLGDSERECTCTSAMINRYRSKLSGPILDRIDLQVEVPRLAYHELENNKRSETSKEIKKRIIRARKIQSKRLNKAKIKYNSQMGSREVRKYCLLSKEGNILLERAFEQLNLSNRAFDRIKKVSRTIADLEGSTNIENYHVAEALQYRSMERK